MTKKLFIVPLLAILFSFCSPKKSKFETDELIGVWSGLLFQTESKYDSLVLSPANDPIEARLYSKGKETVHHIIKKGTDLNFKDSSGFRFDAFLSHNEKTLHGVLTHDLWAQSLDFENLGNQWVTKIHKPEMIDTDYIVYLEFHQDSTGKVQANIQSNKENRELHFTIDEVLIEGNHIDFKITNDRFGISAVYDPEKKNIALTYGNTGGRREIQLKKLNDDELEGYLPKSPHENYVYNIPEAPDSTMQTASLEDVGIDRSLLDLMDPKNNKNLEHIHSILITKDGKLVLEEYFHGYHREYIHDVRSAFKSMASLAMGRAMMKNDELNVENAILDYYPEYNIDDVQKKNITVHHSLTMSTGIQLEDEDKMQWEHDDWVGHKLNLPMAHEPGDVYEYSSGGSNLLTGVIQKSVDTYLPLFIYEELLLPMEIHKFQMLTSPQGRGYLAGSFYMRPIDFAKFGLLVLNKGKWNGEPLISESWIEKSVTPHIKGSWPKNADYGYLWRLLEREIDGKQMKTIEAWGNGGQFLIIIPEIEMTITITGGNYNLFPDMEDRPFSILNEYILPAVQLK
ncbi:beta-lactamase [Allomuricauda ruestringensis DSM 13258]|uniref:Beta-lactamase n=1 Tax=Allomuricauda ruestringensis (strain DSM 13258 / CIP 107369 / LMG 19739 / B1) TaxID=886377 RepID=G2PIU9_ALLRU|nr:serine hydrolase [Allomuricauda ruestringensis]AEM70748.1 beta-lactamase [Allomuricauda ruestringensis DSM 13258]